MILLLQTSPAQPSDQNPASATEGWGSALLMLRENFPFTNLTSWSHTSLMLSKQVATNKRTFFQGVGLSVFYACLEITSNLFVRVHV